MHGSWKGSISGKNAACRTLATLALAVAFSPLSLLSPYPAFAEEGNGDTVGSAAADATAASGESSTGESAEATDDSADASSGEATDGSEMEDLDATINDLGDDNYIDLQQTPESSTLVDTDISELVQAPASLQQTSVQVRGEVVGDALKANPAGTKYWLTFDSLEGEDEGSISVLVDRSVIGLIDTYGSYNKTGTILRVKGTFYVACPSHEGIMDIHAESVTVVEHGSVTQDDFDLDKFVPGFVLCGVGALLAVLYRFLGERQR